MSLPVSVTVDRGATVLHLRGTADPAGVAAARDVLTAAAADAAMVVVDLDETTGGAPDALRDLVQVVAADPERVHVVARRNSVVGLLTQARIHHLVAVHRSIADALAAPRGRG
jgi:membrane-bound ClpP family serine protease